MLELKKVSKYYQSDDTVTQALKDVSARFSLGEFVAITGESGSGKTTLLNVLSGLDSYEDGELTVSDEETSAYDQGDWETYRKKYISFVFQSYNLIDAYSVYENIDLALVLNHYPKDKRKSRVLELIEQVGLSQHVNQKAAKLSGGQKQRVSIARALAKDAPILVADEPTGNLDQETAKDIIALLSQIAKDKLVLFVTHEYDLVKDVATRRIRLFDGEIVEDKTMKSFESKGFDDVPVKELRFIDKLKLALKNLKSTPRKTFFMALISFFIVAIFASSYGSYVQQSNVSNSMFHPLFDNLHPSRVVVTKNDSSAFTMSEQSQLNEETGVLGLAPFDPVVDVYGLVERDNQSMFSGLYDPYHFVIGNSANLSQGRLPDNANEIVVSDSLDTEIGDVISMAFSQRQYADFSSLEGAVKTDMVVVGLHREPVTFVLHAYVDERFFSLPEYLLPGYISAFQFSLEKDGNFLEAIYEVDIDRDLNENEIAMSESYYQGMRFNDPSLPENSEDFIGEEVTLAAKNPFDSNGKTYTVEVVEIIADEERFVQSILISETLVQEWMKEPSYQISLFVEDDFAANQLVDNLPTTYIGIYPASYENTFEQIFSVIGNILQGMTSFILLFIMYFVSYIVLKNVIQSKERSTLIMRSIGAYKKDLYQTLIIELVVVMALSFVSVLGLFVINNTFLNWLPNYFRFFTLSNYLVMIVLLLGLSFFLGRRFQKKLFTRSVMSALREA